MQHLITEFNPKLQFQRAVCGQLVTMNKYSERPDCPQCQAWLHADEEASARALELEWPEFKGRLVTEAK